MTARNTTDIQVRIAMYHMSVQIVYNNALPYYTSLYNKALPYYTGLLESCDISLCVHVYRWYPLRSCILSSKIIKNNMKMQYYALSHMFHHSNCIC